MIISNPACRQACRDSHSVREASAKDADYIAVAICRRQKLREAPPEAPRRERGGKSMRAAMAFEDGRYTLHLISNHCH